MSKLSIYLLFGLLFVPSIVFAAYTKCYVLQGGTVCLNATTISSPYGNITMNSTANNYPTNLTVNQTGSSYSVVLGRFGLGSLMGNFTVSASNSSGGGIGYVNTTGANFNSTNWFIRMINDTTAQAAGVSCNAGDAISTLSNNSVCTSFITPAALSAFGYISSAPNVNITNYTASGSTTSIYLSNGTIYNATITAGSGTGNATSNGTTNYVARFTNGTNIATGSIYDNGTNVGIGTIIPTQQFHITGNALISKFVGANTMTMYGNNDTSQTSPVTFDIINVGTVDDGTGASGRAALSLSTSDNLSDPNRRMLSILAHKSANNNHSNHVSFYSNLLNGSYEGKAFQWKWGNNTDGIFELMNLNTIRFPENYTGFYQNESAKKSSIDTQDNSLNIFLDSNNDSSNGALTIYTDGQYTSTATKIASFNSAGSEINSTLGVNNSVTIIGALTARLAANQIAQLNDGSSASAIWGTNLGFISSSGLGRIVSANSNTNITFETGSAAISRNTMTIGTERMRIDNTGKVAINNTLANSTFHVVGDSNVTGVTYTSVLFVNNTQVCLQNGTNCPAGGSGNVTSSNGTSGFVGVFSSASNLVAMLINSTMIADAAINATHLYTSNGGSAGQVLTLNSTGGMNWSTPSTGSSSGGNASYIGDGITRSVAMVYNSTDYNSTPSVNITSNGTIKITDAIFDNTVSFANQTQAQCAINYTIGLSQTQGRWTTPVDSMKSCLPNPVPNTILNTTTCNSSQSIPIPFDGYLRRAFIMVQTNGTLSSNQNTTYEVYVNGVATGLNGNITMVTRYNATNITNINQRVQFGDYVNIRATYPAWTTNPTQIDQKIGVEISKC